MGLLRLSTVIAALVSIAAAAADDPRREFERGRELYFQGDYAGALPHLRSAYELSNKRPSTIRALAHCERALGMNTEALVHLREYLSTKPPDAKEIEAQIAELEAPKQLEPLVQPPREEEDFVWDAGRRDPEPPELVAPAPDPAVAEPPGLIERPVFWAVLAGVLAAAGTAIALGVTLSDDAEVYGGSEGLILRR